MSATGMIRPMEAEYLKRNPGATVTSRTITGQQDIPQGHVFDRIGERYGRQALAGGILDEGKAQPQFGSRGNMKARVSRPQKSSTPGESLITGKQTTKRKRKRIHGLEKTTGKENSGTVKKQSLGGN